MDNFFSLLWGTLLLRPYVFIFLAMFLFLAQGQIGWKRTLVWVVTGYLLAFLAEYSSTQGSGFPFGDYYYIDDTRDRELWVAGVPFMDSLSFTFLTYVGFSCAWHLWAAMKGIGGKKDEFSFIELRRSWPVLIIGAAVTTLMDVIIDPVTLMGDRWFLGLIYGYEHEGQYFGIPLTNFAGWFVLAAAIIAVNQGIDALLKEREDTLRGENAMPWMPLGGFFLFFCVVAFNLAVTLWLKAYVLFFCGLFLVSLFLAFSLAALKRAGFAYPLHPTTSR